VSRKDAPRKAADKRFCKIAVDLAINNGEEEEENATGDDPDY